MTVANVAICDRCRVEEWARPAALPPGWIHVRCGSNEDEGPSLVAEFDLCGECRETLRTLIVDRAPLATPPAEPKPEPEKPSGIGDTATPQ